jgi:K+-sensing histidine kinase KdpD
VSPRAATRLWTGDRPPIALGVVVAVAAVAGTTALLYPLAHVAPVVSLGVVYLVAVLLVSTFWGAWLGVPTALASVAAFNWFHIPPTGRLSIRDGGDWVALVVLLIAALLVSALSEAARARAREARQRSEEADRAAATAQKLLRERAELVDEAVEAAALRRSDVLKTALLRAVSHDLRSPLTAILTAAGALGSSGVSDSERAELIDGIRAEAARLSRLIDDLLDLSRLEARAAEPRREWCSLAEVLESALDDTVAPAGAFHTVIDPDLPEVRADAAQLRRAFANLLENSLRYSGGHPVSVRARAVGRSVVVRVVDRGPGIPAAQRERVFDPFQRAPSDPAGHRGSGLGLAITRGFVEVNGGRVWVESAPGHGSAFVVELPLDATAPAPPAPAAAGAAARR